MHGAKKLEKWVSCENFPLSEACERRFPPVLVENATRRTLSFFQQLLQKWKSRLGRVTDGDKQRVQSGRASQKDRSRRIQTNDIHSACHNLILRPPIYCHPQRATSFFCHPPTNTHLAANIRRASLSVSVLSARRSDTQLSGNECVHGQPTVYVLLRINSAQSIILSRF